MRILAIDPGPTESAYVVYDSATGYVHEKGKARNDTVLHEEIPQLKYDALVIEQVQSFGMSVGAEVFETVFWSGRFAQAATQLGSVWNRIGRVAVKMHMCHRSTAKDGNIRQAIIDRYSGEAATKPRSKCAACKGRGKVGLGKKRAECGVCKGAGSTGADGALFGISGDVWSALAVAITWADQHAAPAPVVESEGG